MFPPVFSIFKRVSRVLDRMAAGCIHKQTTVYCSALGLTFFQIFYPTRNLEQPEKISRNSEILVILELFRVFPAFCIVFHSRKVAIFPTICELEARTRNSAGNPKVYIYSRLLCPEGNYILQTYYIKFILAGKTL